MTLEQFLQTGTYTDFILIDGTAYPFPTGFKLTKNPQEKSNIVTVASGRKRYDIIKRWYSFTFEYETLTQPMMDSLEAIIQAASISDDKTVYLKKPSPSDSNDYQTQGVSVIKPVKIKYKSRGRAYLYNGVTLEIE